MLYLSHFFQKEVYLETFKDVQKRKCLTQFRISAHRLEVESGRYKKKSVSERFVNSVIQTLWKMEFIFYLIVQPTIFITEFSL